MSINEIQVIQLTLSCAAARMQKRQEKFANFSQNRRASASASTTTSSSSWSSSSSLAFVDEFSLHCIYFTGQGNQGNKPRQFVNKAARNNNKRIKLTLKSKSIFAGSSPQKTLCTLMESCFALPSSLGPCKCIKNADTAKRQRASHSHVQISTCQFMIMAPREARQNVNYTRTDEMKLGRITS